jgi:catalase
MDRKRLTTAGGIPMADNLHSLTAGPRRPLLVRDWQLFENHAHFNRERIPERVLHFRIFSYADAHRYRLGVNYESLPVNAPRCPVHTYHRDGFMRFDGNPAAVNYEPNSQGGPVEDPAFKEPPLKVSGDADPYDHREGNDDSTQAGNLYRLLPPDEKDRLHKALANAMRGVRQDIIDRQLGHFASADPAYAEGVRKEL